MLVHNLSLPPCPGCFVLDNWSSTITVWLSLAVSHITKLQSKLTTPTGDWVKAAEKKREFILVLFDINILHNCFTLDSTASRHNRIESSQSFGFQEHSRIRIVLMFWSVLKILNWRKRQYLKYCPTNILRLYCVVAADHECCEGLPVSPRPHSNAQVRLCS